MREAKQESAPKRARTLTNRAKTMNQTAHRAKRCGRPRKCASHSIRSENMLKLCQWREAAFDSIRLDAAADRASVCPFLL